MTVLITLNEIERLKQLIQPKTSFCNQMDKS
jgi:hypothetical protein